MGWRKAEMEFNGPGDVRGGTGTVQDITEGKLARRGIEGGKALHRAQGRRRAGQPR